VTETTTTITNPTDPRTATAVTAGEPVLKVRFLSHGTLESRDLDVSRAFYERFLGLEVVRTSKVSLMIKLGSNHTYAVVLSPKKTAMSMLNHNGLDVGTREEVDRCYEQILAAKKQWGIKKATRPTDQHGTYCFYFTDCDDNWWEILCNPEGGYSWMFGKGRDIEEWGAGEETGFNPNDYTKRIKSRAMKPVKEH
jgi:catechol 2,3-dioxygenase-like lactoylglutathione lyase family enzyme